MFRWFRTRASLRAKLDIGFGAVGFLIAWTGGVAAGKSLGLLVRAGAAPAPLREATHELAFIVLAAFPVLFLLSILIGALVSRAAAVPLAALTSRLEALAAGDVEDAIGFADHEDEAGRISRSMLALQASAAEERRVRRECDQRGRIISVLVDNYRELAHRDGSIAAAAAPARIPVAATAETARVLESARLAREEEALRRLLTRLDRRHA